MRTRIDSMLLIGSAVLLASIGAGCTDPGRCKIGDPGCVCFAGDLCADGVTCTNGLCTPDCTVPKEASCACTSSTQCSGSLDCIGGVCTAGSCVDYDLVAHSVSGYDATLAIGTGIFHSSFPSTSCGSPTGDATNVAWYATGSGTWVVDLDGSDVDTYVSVQEGTSYGYGEDLCTSQTELACNDDYYLNASSGTSRARFYAYSGNAYLVSAGPVSSSQGSSGHLAIRIVPEGPCSNECASAQDGTCDDGGPDSTNASCTYGTDCSDCGVRLPCTLGSDACACAVGDTCDPGLTCDTWSDKCLPSALALDSSTQCALPPPAYVAPATGACLPTGSVCQFADDCCGFDATSSQASCFNIGTKLGEDVFRCVLDCTTGGSCPTGFTCSDPLASGDRLCVPDCAN